MSVPSVTTSGSSGESARPLDQGFPKSRRLLRPSEFRRVYDQGTRMGCAYFVAFCLAKPATEGSRVGFTTSRALGKAIDRNRLRRRMREAVRIHQQQLPQGWDVVFNPRRAALEAEFTVLEREVVKVFDRCGRRPLDS